MYQKWNAVKISERMNVKLWAAINIIQIIIRGVIRNQAASAIAIDDIYISASGKLQVSFFLSLFHTILFIFEPDAYNLLFHLL